MGRGPKAQDIRPKQRGQGTDHRQQNSGTTEQRSKIHVESRMEKVNCSPRTAKGVADSRFVF